LNLIKSNQSLDEFNEYNFYEKKGYKIDWDKYRIGDLIITSPRAKWGWKPIKTYIKCYCPNCKEIIPDKTIKLKENYFENINDYKCYNCRNGMNYGMYEGVKPSENLSRRICINCFSSFNIYHFINGEHIYDTNTICEDCNNFDKLIQNYFYMSLKYNIYLSCSDCKKTLPKLCQKHNEKMLLYKYSELFKSCKICIKWTPQKCRIHKYYFL
jgi:hypothetical protein